MNERIEKLAYEAEDYADKIVDVGGEFHQHYTQKFAELIVKEFVNVLDVEQWNKGQDWICKDGARIIEKVRQHFGVFDE